MAPFFGESCKEDEPGNLKYELRDSKYEVIVRHTAVMTAATHARLCNTAPQAPDSELRTSYIVIRTFKLRFINRKFKHILIYRADGACLGEARRAKTGA